MPPMPDAVCAGWRVFRHRTTVDFGSGRRGRHDLDHYALEAVQNAPFEREAGNPASSMTGLSQLAVRPPGHGADRCDFPIITLASVSVHTVPRCQPRSSSRHPGKS
jgi:hypothetical protein